MTGVQTCALPISLTIFSAKRTSSGRSIPLCSMLIISSLRLSYVLTEELGEIEVSVLTEPKESLRACAISNWFITSIAHNTSRQVPVRSYQSPLVVTHMLILLSRRLQAILLLSDYNLSSVLRNLIVAGKSIREPWISLVQCLSSLPQAFVVRNDYDHDLRIAMHLQ